jgi:RNA polymerase sigma-70 factor (ECF subfamily)
MKNTIEEIAWISRIVLFDDERAFGKLLDRYHAQVRRMMMAQTGGDDALSDDLTQEVFIKVWLNIRSFSLRSRFSTWLYRIAYNVFIDYCRCRRPTEHLSSAADVAVEEYDDDAERLHGALAELSPPCRACMTLFYLEGMPTRQIAEITAINEATVRSHLSRGRKRMKELIEDERL